MIESLLSSLPGLCNSVLDPIGQVIEQMEVKLMRHGRCRVGFGSNDALSTGKTQDRQYLLAHKNSEHEEQTAGMFQTTPAQVAFRPRRRKLLACLQRMHTGNMLTEILSPALPVSHLLIVKEG